MPASVSRLQSASIMSGGLGDDRPPSISHSRIPLTSTAMAILPLLWGEYGQLWARRLAHLACPAAMLSLQLRLTPRRVSQRRAVSLRSRRLEIRQARSSHPWIRLRRPPTPPPFGRVFRRSSPASPRD